MNIIKRRCLIDLRAQYQQLFSIDEKRTLKIHVDDYISSYFDEQILAKVYNLDCQNHHLTDKSQARFRRKASATQLVIKTLRQ